MKKLYFLLFALTVAGIRAQAQHQLLGLRWDGSRELITSLDVSTSVAADLDTLQGVSSVTQGVSTYDAVGNRYFHTTNLGILVVDGATGNVTDTLNFGAGVLISSLEYDAVSEKLLGVRWTGTEEKFCSIDLSTGAYADLSTIPGVNSIQQGESAIDIYNGRYFFNSSTGMWLLDAATGAVIDSVPFASIHLTGIEYDPNSNRIYGIRWNGSQTVFLSLDLSTKTFSDISPLSGVTSIVQGLSTYNPVSNAYYLKTNTGILEIDPATGAITHAYAGAVNLQGLEAVYQTVVHSVTSPQNQTANPVTGAAFSVATTATAPAYQWQVYNTSAGFGNIFDGGQYSGASTGTLQVTNITGADNGRLYRCVVRSGGFSTPSRIAVLRANGDAGITTGAGQPTFAVYNATDGQLVVETSEVPRDATYRMYDGAGRAVRAGQLEATRNFIPMEGLSGGLYVLRIAASGRLSAFKVLR